MQFSIIIPAYNEAQSIASIIDRTLKARDYILDNTMIDSLEIIVVNDGSQDKTQKIAEKCKEIKLISYEKNRGYGAAIKTGFENASGEILGFLDADGTCDPRFFADLINSLEKNKSDIAIGSRLGPRSKMPKIRRLGNKIYARIINFLGNVKITDCASGMRVLRRQSLSVLYPLPDGLHFTPAMSCKALMNKKLVITEEEMTYKEREGRSKLSVIKDGLRFFQTIGEITLFYRPFKFLSTIGLVSIAIGLAYSINPITYYLINHQVKEWFIYRLISIVVFFITGINFIAVGFLSDGLVSLTNNWPGVSDGIQNKLLKKLLYPRNIFAIGIIIALSGILLNSKVIYQYLTTGHIYVHWVYVLAGALMVLLGIEISVYSLLQKILDMYKQQKKFLATAKPE